MSPPGKPPLLDAIPRTAALLKHAKQDLAGALYALEELRATYSSSPQVLHALCMLRAGHGETEAAVALAKETIPLCLQRGHMRLAGELFSALHVHQQELELSRDQVLMIGGALLKMGDLLGAAQAFAPVVIADPGETRAVKGLLGVADQRVRKNASVEDAIKLYKLLLNRSPLSPLAGDARRGLEEAERRMSRV